MKTQYPKKPIALIISALSGNILLAQPALEMASGGGPSTNGSTITSQTVTFQNNTNNPTGNTFVPFTPTTTVTYTLSNQQYALRTSQNPNRATVSFGGTNNNSGSLIVGVPTYNTMNFISQAPSGDFSSIPSTIGAGIDVTANEAVELFTSAMGLYNANSPTNGSYYMADLTMTFNVPVTDPVLHLVGIGGYYAPAGSTLGFTSDLYLATTGVTLTELSGSPELSVTSNSIVNTATHPSSKTGSGAASGSILVKGTNISQLVFHIYMRGDGGVSTWAGAGEHSGDAWMVGVSMETSLFVLPLNISSFNASAEGNSAVLQWTAATQINTDHYDVQYSQDGSGWESIGEVKVSGDPDMAGNYNYVQYSPATGSAFYRIAQVNTDGSVSYTSIQRLSFGGLAGGLNFYPNPAHGQVTIASSAAATDNIKSVQLLSIDGRVLQVATGFRSGDSFDLSSYPAGVYIFAVRNNDGTTQTSKVQKL
ncbi:MAG TPA: T9SS type A sorting domain-containing protein [Puia sp.]|nr:T9SS type A sorting domain-containing protein [Puia sp.]